MWTKMNEMIVMPINIGMAFNKRLNA